MIDEVLNKYEQIIFWLGRAGMTENETLNSFDILSHLEVHFGSRQGAKQNFHNTVRRTDYIEKRNSEYHFTSEGYKLFTKLEKRISDEEKADQNISEFFNVFLGNEIEKMVMSGSNILEIPLNLVHKGLGSDFVDLLLMNPETKIKELTAALKEEAIFYDDEFKDPVIEITGLEKVHQIEEVRRSDLLGQLVEVEGRVMLQTQTKPRALIAAFECKRCNHVHFISQIPGGLLIRPWECENDICGRKGPFELMGKPETVFVDSQIITLESIKGQLNIKIALKDNQCQPPWMRDGKIIRVVGILKHSIEYYKAGPKSDFEYIIFANSIRFSDESIVSPPTAKDIELFQTWAADPLELRHKIINSIAPHIHGLTFEKDAASLALFSDWTWDKDPNQTIVRSSIHILFIGDPGTAKSQVIRDIIHLSPKGKFAQITGSTKGGLANSAIQINGEWVIKAGIFSHADQGLLGLDEIDKFPSRDDINCLINVLEDQIQIVSKVGQAEIPFNGRTAVLATANPKLGFLTQVDPIIDQLDLPLYIMQRFDLIFVIYDIPEKHKDPKIAEAIFKIHENTEHSREQIIRDIDTDLLRKYILYARSKPVPQISQRAKKQLTDYYLSIRSQSNNGNGHKDPLMTARSLSSLYRLSRAVARRELAAEVTEEHANYAISLSSASIRSLTKYEMDSTAFEYGGTRSQRDRIKDIKDAIIQTCKTKESATLEDITFLKNLDPVDTEHTIMLLKRNGEIMRVGSGFKVIS